MAPLLTKTVILSDCPGALEPFPSQETDWRRAAFGHLPETGRNLWLAAGGSRDAEMFQATGASRWQRIVAVRHAPDSQFDGVLAALKSGRPLPSPAACLALSGENFHGNRNRPWVALEGNLHLTALVSPGAPAASLGLGLTMLPSVAVLDALRACGPTDPPPKIKWVNDIMMGARKVAGVLTSTLAENKTIQHAVLGIGINVGAVPSLPPSPFSPPPGALAELAPGAGFTLPGVLRPLLDSLTDRFGELAQSGPARLLADYTRHSNIIGRAVEIWPEDAGEDEAAPPLAAGVVDAIRPDLGLALRGRAEPVLRGRLVFQDRDG